MRTEFSIDRSTLLGKDEHWKISDLGVMQLQHDYPSDLLKTIRDKALAIKEEQSANVHLNLRFIRNAQKFIPEIKELVHWPGRIESLSELAGTELEPYPHSVISTALTFMGPEDGTVDWHGDGPPVTELVALEVDDAVGGRLEIFQGDFDAAMAAVQKGHVLPSDRMIHLQHKVGSSMFGQLMRVAHRTEPMTRGTRITLTMNLRSVAHPYIENNPMYYLAADNPDFEWVDEYVADVRERQLPAYLAARKAA
ncbi:hypothetical protein F0L17_23800 [Streptomyces sp. TRM43335]|uniref:Fe2OG dioxygenase domain-containing protein n=1 Tax=Streptomyces taklimakanensis TaxID=2569853 RepID=A0A6G2BIG1_9ACTN|nr:hypothetical protein [Streptomyces taklimakanensis]MTE22077.1 hypothetical protein [Streptomyces taklimakanensis]